MTKPYPCRWCSSSFWSSKALSCHIANKKACARRWVEFINSLADTSSFIDPNQNDDKMDLDAHPLEDLEAQAEDESMLNQFDGMGGSFPIPEHDQNDSHESVDSDSEDSNQFEVWFEGAGNIEGKTAPPFANHKSTQRVKGHNIHYPFSGTREWELATWLHESGLPLTKIDKFLHLDYVRIPLKIILAYLPGC
jgi:hypothetical protein